MLWSNMTCLDRKIETEPKEKITKETSDFANNSESNEEKDVNQK